MPAKKTTTAAPRGLTLERRWTTPERHPYDEIAWERRTVAIKNEKGQVAFEQPDVEVPADWSDLAARIVASKYFRGHLGTPERESSVRQIIDRVVDTIAGWGRDDAYFATPADADAFASELRYLLVHQRMAFNSPVWFNVGFEEHPQASACMPYGVRVNTNLGLLPIGEIVRRLNDRSQPTLAITTFDLDGNATPIVAGVSNGVRAVFEIKLADGSKLDMTDDHVVFVRGEDGDVVERKAGDLTPGVDRLILSRRVLLPEHRDVPAGVSLITPDVAWMAGMLVGDGFSGHPQSATSDTWEINLNTGQELGRLEATLRNTGLSFKVDPRHWGFVVRGYGAAGRGFWENIGLWNHTNDKIVPEWVFRAGLDLVAPFLRGLFDADGTAVFASGAKQKRVVVQFANTSHQVATTVQTLLRSLGIFSSLASYEDDRHDSKRKTSYTVTIYDQVSVDLYARLVGFSHADKAARLASRAPISALACRTDDVAVVGRRYRGRQEVFDIQTGSASFWAEGVASHNCFINSIQDDMGSIMDLAKTEAMLFKGGSGAGVNLSVLRGSSERLSKGGTASGPLSFMRGYDAFAGVIRSGGKTRRAAKMVILDADHPDIEDFIASKVKEEDKVRALVREGYDGSFGGEAYSSVFFQNANHSVRLTDEFMRAVEADENWALTARTNGAVMKTVRARELFHQIADATWQCGDPGVQFDTTINDWHTVPADGRIRASNPCVTGETLIATTDGLRRIEELVGKDVSVIGSDGVAHRAERVFPTGHKEVYELRLRSGYRLKLTADHRVLTTDGDVAAKDLTPGNRVVLAGSPFGSEALPWPFGEAIGLAVGDGCICRSERDGRIFQSLIYTMHAEESTVLDVVADELNTQKALREALDGTAMRFSSVSQGKTGSRLAFGSADILELVSSYAVLDHKADGKRFTDRIHELNRESVAAVLRGLFTADGTVVNVPGKSTYVGLDSASLELLQQVQMLLLGFGIKSRLYENRRGGTTTAMLPDGRGGSREYPVKEMNSLRITSASRVRFEREIGFMAQSAKAARLTEINARVSVYRSDLVDEVASVAYLGTEDVFDLTEPVTSHFVANGLVVHNCSEYLSVDDTSCNLASLNLVSFLDAEGCFDIAGFRHAVALTIIAQEIIVDRAGYPTERIGERTKMFRNLGLGPANLGSLLMRLGLAYDSDEGRNYAAALTAIMGGAAYATSATIASAKGPFVRYEANKAPMRAVIERHYQAVKALRETGVPAVLTAAAKEAWLEAEDLGDRWGYRNAQVTVAAPTGTISFMLDCDTTGIEPSIAIVSYKFLVGGGLLKLVNRAVPAGLRALGYTDEAIAEIGAYIKERDTIEGAPGLDPAHLPVFDCAFKAANGTRSIAPMGHIKMMAAIQPFLSGAISKTVNLPNAATVEEIEATYLAAWRMGVKAVAIYRDDCKAYQPVSTKKADEKPTSEDTESGGDETTGAAAVADRIAELEAALAACQNRLDEATTKVAACEAKEAAPARRRLPATRRSVTHRFSVSGSDGYITVGLYPDGRPGELFLVMAKANSTVSGFADSWATAFSIALQHGAPLEAILGKFIHVHFEPAGFTGSDAHPIAQSIVDYVANWMAIEFLTPEQRALIGAKRDAKASGLSAGLAVGPEATTAPLPAPMLVAPAAVTPLVSPAAVPTTAAPASVSNSEGRRCGFCDSSQLVRSGACFVCESCGQTTGCG